ncbi:MAG TPA: preprotein translocase subunit SecG, partial [Acidobacteriota bacterium]|nr:preprotein translocase subunit SecG [Acidobacteriota bacterium]
MFTFLIIIHLLASLVLVLVVLLQSGKAGDLASAFGGAGTQTAFGARGAATVLTKATTVCAVVFMLTSLGLSITYLRGTKGGSVMEG